MPDEIRASGTEIAAFQVYRTREKVFRLETVKAKFGW
jgi:hypothetical protein